MDTLNNIFERKPKKIQQNIQKHFNMELLNNPQFSVFLIPVLIFFARICDVTIGTLRLVMISKGYKVVAPVLGFFEVLIWITVIAKIIENMTNVYCYIAYAAGFATGNYIGMLIEEKMALGLVIVRIITQQQAEKLIENLKAANFGITYFDARGSRGDVNIIYTTIKRTSLKDVVSIIHDFNPDTFYTISDVKTVSHGVFPSIASQKTSIFNRWRIGL